MSKKWFTLVELLVVITILAIISVVAYQNFWWAVDKAVSGRKISDVSTIETSLQQYKVDKNYYPAVDLYDLDTNKWWYNSGTTAKASNTIDVTMDGAEIKSIGGAAWGWLINYKDWSRQIWAKWTISQKTLTKKYLTKDLYDPEVWDLTENTNNKKLIEYWLGRYVYAVYKKPNSDSWDNNNKTWSYYNIAYTIKKDWSDTYQSKIVWDYDEESCFTESSNCSETLIGTSTATTSTGYLVDWQEQWTYNDWTTINNFRSIDDNQWIPYPVSDFE